MKRLLTIFCFVLAAIFGQVALAQQQAPWIELAPAGEYFTVSMPNHPKAEPVTATYGDLQVNGVWYTAGTGDASYAIWSLLDGNYQKGQDLDSYLDGAAELLWESLLRSARDHLPEHRRAHAAMTYTKNLSRNQLAGREYSVNLGELTGTADLYVAEERVFVLLAMNLPDGAWERERFLGSVSFSPNLNAISGYPGPTGIGAGVFESHATTDQPFRTSEVNQKPRILEKPEPSYTESARKFGVTGTVILRCVFSSNGEVMNLTVLRRLPHGLTQRALAAAGSIKFLPAMKDGKPVSMYMQLEYNFNLY